MRISYRDDVVESKHELTSQQSMSDIPVMKRKKGHRPQNISVADNPIAEMDEERHMTPTYGGFIEERKHDRVQNTERTEEMKQTFREEPSSRMIVRLSTQAMEP